MPRAMPVLPVLLAMAVLAAGCVSVGDVGLTAKEAQGKAEPRARAWQGDARFIGLAAIEVAPGADVSGGGMGFSFLPLVRDPHVGDGRALAWGLGYASAAANRTLALVVSPNGTVLAREEPGSRQAPVQDYVDSPRAAEIALGKASFASYAAAPDAVLLMGLGHGDTNVSDPVWALFARSQDRHGGALILIGARAGDVLHEQDFNGTLGVGSGFEGSAGPSTFRFQGSVDPQRATSSHPFNVTEGQGTIQARLDTQGTLPTDGASLDIRDPDNVALESTPPGFGGSGQGQFATRGPGTYVAIVTYQSQGAPALPVGGVQGTSYRLSLQVR